MKQEYRGDGERPAGASDIDWKGYPPERSPSGYRPAEGLVDAVNVALRVKRPLLVTGEPGCGKTLLADSIAWELGLRPAIRYDAKSTSTAANLFYEFDHVSRFYQASTHRATSKADSGKPTDPRNFIEFQALGKAILLSLPPVEAATYVLEPHEEAGRSVVLIDEIDKAPRDFPNDILAELEELYFRIPEMQGARLQIDPVLRPIIIITSNSEANRMWLPLKLLEQVPGNPAGICHEWERSKKFWPS